MTNKYDPTENKLSPIANRDNFVNFVESYAEEQDWIGMRDALWPFIEVLLLIKTKPDVVCVRCSKPLAVEDNYCSKCGHAKPPSLESIVVRLGVASKEMGSSITLTRVECFVLLRALGGKR